MATNLGAEHGAEESLNRCPCCGNPLPDRLYISDTLSVAVIDGERIQLTQHETCVLKMIQTRPGIKPPDVCRKLYGGTEGPKSENKVVHLYVFNIRKKTAHTAMKIVTQWRNGYWLEWK